MARRAAVARGRGAPGEDFSFVSPAVKYVLFFFNMLFFLITFCGCVGSLRENICLLQTFSVCLTIVFLLQLAAGVLGFVFSDKARGKVSEIINGAIVHYRDDLDLQNLIDFGQKELVGILLAQILINQIRDQIKLQLYNQQHRADPWY